jgi:hypothetical protein
MKRTVSAPCRSKREKRGSAPSDCLLDSLFELSAGSSNRFVDGFSPLPVRAHRIIDGLLHVPTLALPIDVRDVREVWHIRRLGDIWELRHRRDPLGRISSLQLRVIIEEVAFIKFQVEVPCVELVFEFADVEIFNACEVDERFASLEGSARGNGARVGGDDEGKEGEEDRRELHHDILGRAVSAFMHAKLRIDLHRKRIKSAFTN